MVSLKPKIEAERACIMSDENTVIPDSSSLSAADGDDSQGATRSTVEQGTEDLGAKDSSKETQSRAADDSVVQRRLSDTEAALKDRQREFTEISLKLAELKGQMSVLSQRNDEPDDPMSEVLDDELLGRASTEPDKVLKELVAREHKLLGKTLQQRDDYWKDEMRKMLDEHLNPERLELRETISELSKKSWFSKLGPNEQVEAAREYKRMAPASSVEPPAGSMGGTGRRTPPAQKDMAEERRKQAEETMKAHFSMSDSDNKLMPSLSVDTRVRR